MVLFQVNGMHVVDCQALICRLVVGSRRRGCDTLRCFSRGIVEYSTVMQRYDRDYELS